MHADSTSVRPELSLTSDFLSDSGYPEPALQAIAAAGFTHVHWCHHWCTDFLYGPAEIAAIGTWLKQYGLKLRDLHGTSGHEKCWWSQREYERLAGVELVVNRLRMTAELGGTAVVLHVPRAGEGPEDTWDRLRCSLDAMIPEMRQLGVRVAFENMPDDDFWMIRRLLKEYGDDIAGLCYDCGHGNMGEARGLAYLEEFKDRLLVMHLHDNDGTRDQHMVPFTGTVDFPTLTGIVARSAYQGCITLESNVGNVAEAARPTFVDDAFRAARRLNDMVAAECRSEN
jgi:sugar phosphate isomerase/epimerase